MKRFSLRSTIAIAIGITMIVLLPDGAAAQGLVPFKNSAGLYGYKNHSGTIIVQPKYEWAGEFEDDSHTAGYAGVKLNGKYTLICKDGKFLKPGVWYDSIDHFYGGFSIIKNNGKYNWLDTKGKLLSPQLWFDQVVDVSPDIGYGSDFSYGFAEVKLNGKWNFISRLGKILSPSKWYDATKGFGRGIGCVKLNGKWNFIDGGGKVLSAKWFDEIYPFLFFIDGYARVKLNGRWNSVNTLGSLLSKELWFDDVMNEFSEGYAVIKVNGKYNWIDERGTVLYPNVWFDFARYFFEGYADFYYDGLKGRVNNKGEIVWY